MAHIQKIGVESVQALQDIAQQTFYDTFKDTTAPDAMEEFLRADYAIDVLTKELEDPDSAVYFLYEEGELAGYLKLNTGAAQTEQVADNAMELQRIYILPAFKRRGLGTQLMEFAMAEARHAGVDAIWLGVWERNFPAQALYKRYGFEHVGEHVFQVGDQADTDYIYLKKL